MSAQPRVVFHTCRWLLLFWLLQRFLDLVRLFSSMRNFVPAPACERARDALYLPRRHDPRTCRHAPNLRRVRGFFLLPRKSMAHIGTGCAFYNLGPTCGAQRACDAIDDVHMPSRLVLPQAVHVREAELRP